MQKQAPSLGRIFVMVAFALSCFGLLLFLWLAFGGPGALKPKGYRVPVEVAGGAGAPRGAPAPIAARAAGRGGGREERPGGPDGRGARSDVTIELQSRFAPLRSDARAILRQKTLL